MTPTNPMREEFSFEVLSSLYRQEIKTAGLVQTRKDIYRRMTKLTQDATDALVEARKRDPESAEAENLRTKRKTVIHLCRSVKAVRANKIASMAVRAADGNDIDTKNFTDEEIAFFKIIRDNATKFFEEVGC